MEIEIKFTEYALYFKNKDYICGIFNKLMCND